jgi:hypothetical protein
MNDTTRNAHIAERRSMLRTELTVELLAAFANGEGMLREFRKESEWVPGVIVQRDLPSMLRDMLDDVKANETESALMRALVNVLMHSEYPEVGSWRLLAAHQYAERADDIADMEQENQS